MTPSVWNVDTLLALMNERDRRYAVERESDQRALFLAAQVAKDAQGKVSVVATVSVIAGLLGAISLVMQMIKGG
jgi:hypothetical protein